MIYNLVFNYYLFQLFLQCFDTAGQVPGRASSLQKLSDGVVVVICLEQGADCLHVVQLMPLPSQNSVISCLI